MSTCQLPDCDLQNHAKGYCREHYRQWAYHGDPLARIRAKRGTFTYQTMHEHLRRTLGQAEWWLCVDCGSPANQWSLNHGSGNLRVGEHHGSRVLYSLNRADYDPRCHPCHKQYDSRWRRTRTPVADSRGEHLGVRPTQGPPSAGSASEESSGFLTEGS